MSLPVQPAPWSGPSPLPGPTTSAGDSLRARARAAGLCLTSGRTACGEAREFTERVLGDWELDQLRDDALTVVSELVANAVLHGPGGDAGGGVESEVLLRLKRRPAHLMCAVTDRGETLPSPGHLDASLEEGGRGLIIVEALSQHWGWTRCNPVGKTVWAMLLAEART
ncbi:ATP-binding protein [Streptomyces sp. NPDC050523]|uniref:ATP-binding protein n=1 Tax=Streptomyces sp. NPDC050523 TaxID=3365622 RepID=UPI0037B25F97